MSQVKQESMDTAKGHSCKNMEHKKKTTKTSVMPASWYTCGECLSKFKTICTLHTHIAGHKKGGSYSFDHITNTAFPKFDSVCVFTQSDENIFVEVRHSGVPDHESDQESTSEETGDVILSGKICKNKTLINPEKCINKRNGFQKNIACSQGKQKRRKFTCKRRANKKLSKATFVSDDKLSKKILEIVPRNENHPNDQTRKMSQTSSKVIASEGSLSQSNFTCQSQNVRASESNGNVNIFRCQGQDSDKDKSVSVSDCLRENDRKSLMSFQEAVVNRNQNLDVGGTGNNVPHIFQRKQDHDSPQKYTGLDLEKNNNKGIIDVQGYQLQTKTDSFENEGSCSETLTFPAANKSLENDNQNTRFEHCVRNVHRGKSSYRPKDKLKTPLKENHAGMFHVKESVKDYVKYPKGKGCEQMAILVVSQCDENDTEEEDTVNIIDMNVDPETDDKMEKQTSNELHSVKHKHEEIYASETLIAISQSKYMKEENTWFPNDNTVKHEIACNETTVSLTNRCEEFPEYTMIVTNELNAGISRSSSNIPVKLTSNTYKYKEEMIDSAGEVSNLTNTTRIVNKKEGKRCIRRDCVCPVCGKVGTKSMVSYHKYLHKKDKELTCDVCGIMFKSPACLKMHLKSHGDKEFKCDQCPAQFHRKKYLEVHMYKHSGLKPHTCETCGKSYRDAGHLKRHVRHVHENLRKFECDLCGDRFYRADHLKCHRERHFAAGLDCKVCGRTFKLQTDLNRHLAVHSDEKKWHCYVCGKGFRTPVSYYSHMLKQHKITREVARDLMKIDVTAMKAEESIGFTAGLNHDEFESMEQPYRYPIAYGVNENCTSVRSKCSIQMGIASVSDILPNKGRLLIVKGRPNLDLQGCQSSRFQHRSDYEDSKEIVQQSYQDYVVDSEMLTAYPYKEEDEHILSF